MIRFGNKFPFLRKIFKIRTVPHLKIVNYWRALRQHCLNFVKKSKIYAENKAQGILSQPADFFEGNITEIIAELEKR